MDELDVPVVVNCRDRVTPLRALLAWLERAGHRRIVLLDNASTYPDLLELYATTAHEVVRLGANAGPRALWETDALASLRERGPFVLTDPDIVPDDGCPADAVAHLLAVLARRTELDKVGLGLRVDDLPAHYALRDDVRAWEAPFWEQELEPGVFDAPVDTTFAAYRPGVPYRQDTGARTGPPYVARHLSWYVDSAHPSDEDTYYEAHARRGFGTWRHDAAEWPVAAGLALRANRGERAWGGGLRARVTSIAVLVESGGVLTGDETDDGAPLAVGILAVDTRRTNRARALNEALRESDADACCLVRPGETVDRGALARVADTLRDRAWLRAAVTVVDDDGRELRAEGHIAVSLDELEVQDPVERPFLCWRRDALDGSGPFDPAVPLVCEYDLELRLAALEPPLGAPVVAARRVEGEPDRWPPYVRARDEQLARVRARVLARALAATTRELEDQRARTGALDAALRELQASEIWRATQPLRWAVDRVRRRRG